MKKIIAYVAAFMLIIVGAVSLASCSKSSFYSEWHKAGATIEKSNMFEAITVEDLAKALYISRSHLSTIFKQKTGENLSQFIMRQKIEEAKKLLKTSKKSAIDIAFYLGFSSQSHFSRTFKEYVHMTPNEYRHSTK